MTSNVFNSLRQQFPSSESLFAWLKSPEGGSLVIRDARTHPDDDHVLIHYTKESNMSLEHVGYFRSVVWNATTNYPVCVAPTKSLPASEDELYFVEDFIDGVMINMFWTKNGWRLATRSKLDATNTYYSRRSFASLFYDTAMAARLDFRTLDPTYTYSWVLQHPAERVVVAPSYGIPRLYLVEMRNQEFKVVRDCRNVIPATFMHLLPKRHVLATAQEVHERVNAWGARFGYQWKGLMVKTELGRWKVVSQQYMEAATLRGNSSKLPYIWLERFSTKQLHQYLSLYPEDTTAATNVVEAFKKCTQEAYNLYQQIYKNREFPLRDAPQKYRKLLWDIHAARAGSYFQNLVAFMNQQDTARKLWLVNYEVRYGQPSDSALNDMLDEMEGQAAVRRQEEAEEAEAAEAHEECASTQPDSVA